MLETKEHIEECRSLGALYDFAHGQAKAELVAAAITAAYYIGHGDGQKSPSVQPNRSALSKNDATG